MSIMGRLQIKVYKRQVWFLDKNTDLPFFVLYFCAYFIEKRNKLYMLICAKFAILYSKTNNLQSIRYKKTKEME